jgi:hypothetical protein
MEKWLMWIRIAVGEQQEQEQVEVGKSDQLKMKMQMKMQMLAAGSENHPGGCNCSWWQCRGGLGIILVLDEDGW